MNFFAVGDLHLSLDEKVKKPMEIFGFEWREHWKKLEIKWREKVGKEDTVLVLGDTSWALKLEEAIADLKWIADLPGKKIMIKGNHDLWWQSIGKLNRLYKNMIFLQGKAVLIDDTVICGTRGWTCPGSEPFTEHDEKIYKRELLRLGFALEDAKKLKEKNPNAKNIIGCLHFPPTNDKYQPSGFTEKFEEAGVNKVFYGHLHGKEIFKKGFQGNLNGVSYRLVSLDYLDFDLYKIKI